MSKPLMAARILRAAVRLARAHGFRNYSRDEVAALADVAEGSISYRFGNFAKLQDAVIEWAIKQKDLPLIAQGIVAKHPLIKNIPDELRRAACNAL